MHSLSVAAFYFAALTGRDILIEDQSMYGRLCRVLKCGFPFRSQYLPDDFSKNNSNLWDLYEPDGLNDFLNTSSKFEVDSLMRRVLVLDGFNGGERFFGTFNESMECALQLTGPMCNQPNVPMHICLRSYALGRSYYKL